jgi:hypothetical protein
LFIFAANPDTYKTSYVDGFEISSKHRCGKRMKCQMTTFYMPFVGCARVKLRLGQARQNTIKLF